MIDQLPTDVFSDKEKVSIILKEYDTLRAELVARTGFGFQLVSVFSGIATALFTWWSTAGHPIDRKFSIAMTVLVSVGVWFVIAAFWPIRTLAARVAMIETKVNQMVGADVLGWENRKKSPLSPVAIPKNSN